MAIAQLFNFRVFQTFTEFIAGIHEGKVIHEAAVSVDIIVKLFSTH